MSVNLITRRQLYELLKQIAEKHYQINSFGWGDVPEILGETDIIYPLMMVTPQPISMREGEVAHTYLITICDRLQKGNDNKKDVDSDMYQVWRDVVAQLEFVDQIDFGVEFPLNPEPVQGVDAQGVYGFSGNISIIVDENYDSCAVPSDPVIFDPTITCAPATWTLKDSLNATISSGSINSGDDVDIPAPNGIVNIRKTGGGLIEAKPVVSNGVANAEISDSTITNDATTPTYTQAVKATENLILPAQNILVNSVNEGQINSVGDININLSDGVNPVIPISSIIVGRDLSILLATAPVGSGIKHVNIWSGQFTSYDTNGVDEGGLFQSGYFNDWGNDNPEVIAELDPSAGANYWRTMKTPLTVNGVSSTDRYVDVNGLTIWSSSGNADLAVIDKLTATMFLRSALTGSGNDGRWQERITAADGYSATINSILYNDWIAPPLGFAINALGIYCSSEIVVNSVLLYQRSVVRFITSTTDLNPSTAPNNYALMSLGSFSKTFAVGVGGVIPIRKCHNLISI